MIGENDMTYAIARLVITVVVTIAALLSTPYAVAEPILPVKVELSPSEQLWIENNPVIRVAGPVAFPPFHFYDEQGAEQGIASEYIDILAATLDIEVEYLPATSWPDVLEGMQNKEIDIIACAAISEDRRAYMDFSYSFLSFPMIIISRRDAPFIAGLDDLHGLSISMVQNVSTYAWLVGDKIDFTPVFVSTPLDALQAVSNGTADVYVGNLAAASYLIEKHGLANLKVAAPTTYGNYSLHMAVRNDWPILLSIVDKVLRAIPDKTETSIRNKWIKVRYEHGIRTADIIKWIAIVGMIGLLIIFTIAIWNRKLQREISVRKKAEHALRQALDEVQTLSGLLPICASCKNIRDDKGYWTQIEEYIGNHSQASFSHGICPDCVKKLYPEFTGKTG
jgi:ABC-type amino acid transport substrate-binding protein